LKSSSFIVWLKVSGVGLVLGGLVYGAGEMISLLQKTEHHLRKISDKQQIANFHFLLLISPTRDS
jgi:hypothetical protein